MKEPEMREMTMAEVASELKKAFQVANIDPGRDTIVDASRKFGELGLRHLVLYLSTGGFLCLCSDEKMSRKIREALQKIEDELEAEETSKAERSVA